MFVYSSVLYTGLYPINCVRPSLRPSIRPALPGIHLDLYISRERPCELFLPCGVMQQGHALKTSEIVQNPQKINNLA